jgi:hypothetical protein
MDKIGNPNFQGLTCVGYQNLPVTGTAAFLPNVPANTLSALVVLVANTSSVAGAIVAHFREDGTTPTTTEGMPMTNLTRYGVLRGNLQNFRVVSADGLAHSLRIEYFA